MGHNVHRPTPLPRIIRGASRIFGQWVEAGGDSGIGAEQVDASKSILRLLDEMADLGLMGHVAPIAYAVNRSGDVLRPIVVEIGYDDLPGTFTVEPLA